MIVMVLSIYRKKENTTMIMKVETSHSSIKNNMATKANMEIKEDITRRMETSMLLVMEDMEAMVDMELTHHTSQK